jgi:hypothetical protein
MVVSMAVQPSSSNLSVGQFAERYRREMIPLNKNFSYYCASLPLTEEDIKEYLEEPIAALPASIAAKLPKISILLVPYLERAQGPQRGAKSREVVCMEKPARDRVSWSSRLVSKEETVLVFALKDQEVADYHYRFYHLLAALVADQTSEAALKEYASLLRTELSSNVNGEVDDESWHKKQAYMNGKRTGKAVKSVATKEPVQSNDAKLFKEYVRQSFADTLTLYLHGICCDIDVETGPRQLPSRQLRRRLEVVRSLYPPPSGYVLFPEELDRKLPGLSS